MSCSSRSIAWRKPFELEWAQGLPMTDERKRQRIQDMKNAIAQQSLEGIALSPEMQRELLRVASGEKTVQAALAALAAKSEAGGS